jgi:hypothetical protein
LLFFNILKNINSFKLIKNKSIMMKKQRISREVVIYRSSPNPGEEFSLKSFLICGEISGRLVWKALSIPTLEFLEKFAKNSESRKNLIDALEVKDSKGTYLFHEETGSVLRGWTSRVGGNAQIDPYNLDMYRRPPEKYERNHPPAKISSDNVDLFKSQKNLVLMLRKYVNFLNEY